MGSEMWHYWADYERDMQAVLDKARKKAFEDGEYYLAEQPDLQHWDGQPIDTDNPHNPNNPPDYLAYLQWLEDVGGNPRTIQELIDWNAPSGEGTRSIIDIEEIGTELYYGSSAAPVPDNLLLEWFGTTRPTRQVVEEKLGEIWDLTTRGTAVYVVVYEDDEPRKVLFVGSSHD